MRVFIQGAAATPTRLVEAMVGQADRLRNVEVVHIHTDGPATYTEQEYQESFTTNTFFIGANTRQAVREGRAHYVPMFLSEIPRLFRSGNMPIDVALLHLSPPDKHGFCSMGTSVDVTKAAADMARYRVAQINPQMPRTLGDASIHISELEAYIEVDEPLFTLEPTALSQVERKIGQQVAEIIEDGATLQMGIGAIPNAVLSCLGNHKDLGVHTEMFSDGIMPLIKMGVINGSQKRRHRGKVVSGFAMGTRALYDFMDDNPSVRMLDIGYVNKVDNIARNPKVTAINSAIEVDVTGQVCADSIGSRMFSGVGGQMDFIRGASLSDGGKPIIALPSCTRHGKSRIVTRLQEGAGVVTTRAHVHYVATEHGIAYLYGKSLKERVRALIRIAHPDHQEQLERESFGKY